MDFQETEVKFYIQDLPRLAEKLRLSGAELVRPRMLERNFRLDTADQALAKKGCLLRLRQDDQVRITYKEGGYFENGVISRKEIEFSADDFEIAKKLFEALGYQVNIIYEKYRQIYRLGDVEVSLDELPFGHFAEIEAANNTLIEGVAQMLGLDFSCAINTNYLGLFAAAKKVAHLDFNDLTFENFNYIKITPAVLNVRPADN